jgi:hypothetical protein
MTDNFHPAVCPHCCRRAALRGRIWQTPVWAGDAAFALRELAGVAGGALLNLYALALFLLSFFDGKRRLLTLTQRQGLAELRLSQMDISRKEREVLQSRQRILDGIARTEDPGERPYAELDECEWVLKNMAADWGMLEKTRLEIEYRG